MRFTSRNRIRKSEEFHAVRRRGSRMDCGCFIAQALIREGEVSRLGVIASRKVGNAVKRNRAKRIFREIFRSEYNELPEGSDLVIVVRSNFDKYDFSQIKKRFLEACKKFKGEK